MINRLFLTNWFLKLNDVTFLIYSTIVEILFTMRITRWLIKLYFSFLGIIYICSLYVVNIIGKTNLPLAIVLITFVFSKLHISQYVIYFFLYLLGLEAQRALARKYFTKKHIFIGTHWPNSQDPKRNMHRITQAIADSAQNPLVASTALAVGGVLLWKGLDVIEYANTRDLQDAQVQASAAESERDRQFTALENEKDRQAEDRRLQMTLDAEATERQKDREAEALERQKDREAEGERVNKSTSK